MCTISASPYASKDDHVTLVKFLFLLRRESGWLIGRAVRILLVATIVCGCLESRVGRIVYISTLVTRISCGLFLVPLSIFLSYNFISEHILLDSRSCGKISEETKYKRSRHADSLDTNRIITCWMHRVFHELH